MQPYQGRSPIVNVTSNACVFAGKKFLRDFLEIENIYQNNLYKRNVLLETGYTKIQKNKCIDRSLPIWKINMNDLILQT